MPRGNNNNNRGGGGSARGTPRGCGRRGRGRGRGHPGSAGRGAGRGGGLDYMDDLAMDFVVQVWPDADRNPSRQGNGNGRGRGQGRGRGRGMQSPRPDNSRNDMGNATPRGWGTATGGGRGTGEGRERGRGRGAGIGASDTGRRRGMGTRVGAPLSRLIDRPLLRPVKFVPSVYTRTLFQQEEDILLSVPEKIGAPKQNDVPTANRVARVFSGGIPTQQDMSAEDDSGDDTEELEEINFADLGRIRDEIEAAAAAITDKRSGRAMVVEEQFTGFYVDSNPTPADTAAIYRAPNDAVEDNEPEESPQAHIDSDMGTNVLLLSDTMKVSATISNVFVDVEGDEEVVAPPEREMQVETNIVHEQEGADFLSDTIDMDSASNVTPNLTDHHDLHTDVAITVEKEHHDDPPLFFIDTQPDKLPPNQSSMTIAVDRVFSRAALGEPDEEIVYVAPHPRSGRASVQPTGHIMQISSTSIITGTSDPTTKVSAPMAQPVDAPAFSSVSFSFASPSPSKQPLYRPVFSAGARSKVKAKAQKKEARIARKRTQLQAMFGSFGAILSEERLRDEGWNKKDPRWEQRRREDSDVDWGDEDEEVADGVDDISNGLGGMELDSGMEMDFSAMKSFVASMSSEGGRHVTMDDIADEERMMEEDEDNNYMTEEGSRDGSESEDSDDDDEAMAFAVEEELMIAEAEETLQPNDSDSEDDSSLAEDDNSPKSGFKARLNKMREKSRETKVGGPTRASEEYSSDEEPPWTRADNDEEYMAHIEDMLEKHSHIVDGKDRKQRKALMNALTTGDLSDFYDPDDFVMTPARRKKQKNKDLPAALQAQWEKDRAKKADYKQKRAEARRRDAADPFTIKKGGKKGRKAMLAAAKSEGINKLVDISSLEKQIRRFLDNIGGKREMVLPPMNKYSRALVHELANAFNLKSISKDDDEGRYTTLIKATRSGLNINEGKIQALIRRTGGDRFDRPDGYGKNKDKGKNITRMPRHKEGDEVGKAAPKIGENNIGFKMLASMGWADGERIGLSSLGLDAPLTAIIKNTKSGLGATR